MQAADRLLGSCRCREARSSLPPAPPLCMLCLQGVAGHSRGHAQRLPASRPCACGPARHGGDGCRRCGCRLPRRRVHGRPHAGSRRSRRRGGAASSRRRWGGHRRGRPSWRHPGSGSPAAAAAAAAGCCTGAGQLVAPRHPSSLCSGSQRRRRQPSRGVAASSSCRGRWLCCHRGPCRRGEPSRQPRQPEQRRRWCRQRRRQPSRVRLVAHLCARPAGQHAPAAALCQQSGAQPLGGGAHGRAAASCHSSSCCRARHGLPAQACTAHPTTHTRMCQGAHFCPHRRTHHLCHDLHRHATTAQPPPTARPADCFYRLPCLLPVPPVPPAAQLPRRGRHLRGPAAPVWHRARRAGAGGARRAHEAHP